MSGIFVFLGGTCGNNNWCEQFTIDLIEAGVCPQSIFNPVLPPGVEWTQTDADREHTVKCIADFNLFYIADSKQEGNPVSVYSIVEAVMGLYQNEKEDSSPKTVVVFDMVGMTGHALKAVQQTAHDLRRRFPEWILDSGSAVQWLAEQIQSRHPDGWKWDNH